MPFFVKTEIIKKEYLINNDLKRKIINEHIYWIKKLKKEGLNIKSCFLVDELNRPGDGALLILEMNYYSDALKIILILNWGPTTQVKRLHCMMAHLMPTEHFTWVMLSIKF